MTKIKTTKKGMAKKTLSMSLVLAMLATSNVPVWAADFSDGTDTAVAAEAEAPVVDSTEEFSDDAAAEVEAPVAEENTEAVAATTSYTDDSSNVNIENYTLRDVKFETGSWDSPITVSGSITDALGNPVKDLSYTWLADGVQAAGNGAAYVYDGTETKVTDITYKPTKEDFNKTLSLVIYKKGADGATVFSQTITGDTVKPKDLSNPYSEEPNFKLQSTTYTGKELKLTPANEEVFQFNLGNIVIKPEQMVWNYTTDGNDFTNVTKKDITVIGTLEGTYDKNSTAYGYTFTSKSAKYQITQKPLTSSNVEIEMKKTSVPFIGGNYTFGKADITLNVVMDDGSKVDITDALKANTTFVGPANAVGKNKQLADNSVGATVVKTAFDTTNDTAKAILRNYDINTLTSGTLKRADSYEVTVLNLSACTGEVTTEYLVDDFAKDPTVDASDIVLKTADGLTFTANQLGSNINISVNQNAINAAKNKITGVVQNAVTISFKADTNNVTGSISLPINLTTLSLSGATVSIGATNLNTTKTASSYNYTAEYNGEAKDLTKESGFAVKVGGTTLKTGEYEVSYDDNVNAGVVTVTITGKGSYAGSTKKVYFKINPATVAADALKTAESVTVNPDNNYDASLYKDALKAKIETTLNNGKKVTLEEGKDYTVKYYYGKAGATSVDELTTTKAGANKVDDYVYAVATPVNKGNYTFTGDKLFASAPIVAKSINGVTITLDKDTYTFTGKEIVPNITVKDGSSVLEKGVDYTVTVKDGVNVGTATVTIKATATSGYNTGSTASTTFTITPAKAEDVKVALKENAAATAIKTAFDYTGKQIKPVVAQVTLNGVNVTKYFDVTYPTYGENVSAGKEAGSVTITPVKTTANFTGTKTQLFDITGKELAGNLNLYYNDKTKVTVASNVAQNKDGQLYNFYYDGTEQKFASEVFTASTKGDITDGTDYEIKYINNTDAGYGFVAVVAKGNYEANAKNTTFNNKVAGYKVENGKLYYNNRVIQNNIVDIVAFGIQPSYFTAKNITVTNGTYAGGIPVKPQVTVTVNGKTLVEGTDYTLSLTSIDGVSTPDKFVDATTNKPYYVTIHAKGGYKFDSVNGTSTYVWGIDKKDVADCDVKLVKDGDKVDLTVMNGNVVETKENFDVKDNGDGTYTVSASADSKNYTGSKTVDVDAKNNEKPATPVIASVAVSGNKATVTLEGEAEGAIAYDYVIGTSADCIETEEYVAESYGQVETSVTFSDLAQGTYYAYCRAWKRDDAGKKVYSDWSAMYPISIKVITPETPVITETSTYTKNGKKYLTVKYTQCADAENYAVVVGTDAKKSEGQLRPVEVKYTKNNIVGTKVTTTFVVEGNKTYYVGLRAYNKTGENGKKVYSKWSNIKTQEVK